MDFLTNNQILNPLTVNLRLTVNCSGPYPGPNRAHPQFRAHPPARGARLLPLEPRPEAVLVEDVPAGELLGGGRHRHVVPADDADRVGGGQLLGRGVRVVHVHVVDGAPGKDMGSIKFWHQL